MLPDKNVLIGFKIKAFKRGWRFIPNSHYDYTLNELINYILYWDAREYQKFRRFNIYINNDMKDRLKADLKNISKLKTIKLKFIDV